MPLALAAQDAGYDVAVVTHVNNQSETIRRAGIRLIPFNLSRRGMNPLSELAVLARLIKVYREEKPDLIHHVAMKPVLYGTLAALVSGVPRVVNLLAGLGYVFTSERQMARFLRPIIGNTFRVLFRNKKSCLIVQNQDDYSIFVSKRLVNEKSIRLIKGSGVDTSDFTVTPESSGIPIVILASRMLWDKGIKEFVEASSQLRSNGIGARFVLVGDTDIHNPSAVSAEQLEAWQAAGVIEWWGHRKDMSEVFSLSHIVCLPSFYGEGVPKVLIEAAACGRPIVTTDMPGCREIVKNRENGLLVTARSSSELAKAIQCLIENPELRLKMGLRGREIAVNEFSIEKVIKETLAVYDELLSI